MPKCLHVLKWTSLAAIGLISFLGISHNSNTAFAWGSLGHEVIAEVAAELTQDGNTFWSINATAIGFLANTPDREWKEAPFLTDEKPTHWFQVNHYVADPRTLPSLFRAFSQVVAHYSRTEVIENGTALWRVEQLYDMAVEAFKNQDALRGLQIAGVMAHYIGDLSQPLHVTSNYDGELTNNKGIHKFFESTNVQRTDKSELKAKVTERVRSLLAQRQFTAAFEGPLYDGLIQEVARSHDGLAPMLELDTHLGRNGLGAQKQLALAIDNMSDGAAVLSLVLSKVWREARASASTSKHSPAVPPWIPPGYGATAAPDNFIGIPYAGREVECR